MADEEQRNLIAAWLRSRLKAEGNNEEPPLEDSRD